MWRIAQRGNVGYYQEFDLSGVIKNHLHSSLVPNAVAQDADFVWSLIINELKNNTGHPRVVHLCDMR